MMKSTMDALRAVLRTDETIQEPQRRAMLAQLNQPDRCATPRPTAEVVQRIIRRREAARCLGCSVRTIDKLAADGILQKRRLPGRTRAAGFLERDINALLGALEMEER